MNGNKRISVPAYIVTVEKAHHVADYVVVGAECPCEAEEMVRTALRLGLRYKSKVTAKKKLDYAVSPVKKPIVCDSGMYEECYDDGERVCF